MTFIETCTVQLHTFQIKTVAELRTVWHTLFLKFALEDFGGVWSTVYVERINIKPYSIFQQHGICCTHMLHFALQ